MKKIASAAYLSFMLLFCAATAQAKGNEVAIANGINASEQWLRQLDLDMIDESWDSAAPVIQAAVTKEQWRTQLAATRGPYGHFESREQKSAMFTRTLPGAPEGDYVVITYKSLFANKALLEIVVASKLASGSWKISGYHIQ